jgi:hypothetical protein
MFSLSGLCRRVVEGGNDGAEESGGKLEAGARVVGEMGSACSRLLWLGRLPPSRPPISCRLNVLLSSRCRCDVACPSLLCAGRDRDRSRVPETRRDRVRVGDWLPPRSDNVS